MQPSLSLTYSSQAPIYGGIAAGWSLGSLPLITLDTSDGRLKAITHDEKHYTSTLAGGRPFIPVADDADSDVAKTYRAQNDASWTRYERIVGGATFQWRARTPDGATLYFGDNDHVGSCSIVSDEYAPLTRQIDRFGNAVEYFYEEGFDNECHIHHITWGQNTNAGITYFAAAEFHFMETPTCAGVHIGSSVSWRTGTKIGSGTSRLTSITLAAFSPGSPGPGQVIPTTPEHRRVITLDYDSAAEACEGNHAPFRSLVSIQETASGIDSPEVSLPAVLFEYGESSIGEGSLAWGAASQVAPPWAGGSSLGIVTSPLGTLDDNLGWGYRFSTGPRWPTVEAMMIDVDGDGLIDRLTNNPVISDGAISRCRASWQRNRGQGRGFAAPQNIEMPTLKWKSIEADDTKVAYFAGGPHANSYLGLVDEGCSLNYQITAYRNSTNTAGGFRCYPGATACPTGGNHPYTCPTTHDDCSEKLGTPSTTILAFRWIDIDNDGRVDLVASPATGGLNLYNFQHGNLPAAPSEPSIFGGFPGCPATTYTAFPGAPPYLASAGTPYTMCGGMFPWFVYKNKGNGTFGISQGASSPTPDEILYQPVPLETSNGDSSMTSNVVGQFQGTIDVDGDGFLDAVQGDPMGVGSWAVYLGNRDGVFTPGNGASPYPFSQTAGLSMNVMELINPGDPITQEVGLLDLNADGLVDSWQRQSGTPFVTYNSGIGFDVPAEILPFRPSSDGVPGGLTFITTWHWPTEGYRTDSSRPFDLDLDGRVDILRDPSGGSAKLQSYFNTGGAFSPFPRTIGDAESFGHHLVVSSRIQAYWTSNPAYSWEIRSDLLDIDGDRIPEQLDFGQDPGVPHSLYLRQIPTPDKPPRLLVSIDNQRGAKTEVSYAPTTNAAVVAQQHATMPQIQWVVQSQTTTDTLDVPTTMATTSYRYVDPRFGPDERGHYLLRGFEQIETALPSGAMREDEYKFDVDLTGRLARTLMHEAGDMSLVHSIEETRWEKRLLFADGLETHHPVAHASWACSNNQTEAQCLASPAGYTQSSSTLSALDGRSGPCMWVETESLLQSDKVAADGDRQTVTAYDSSIDESHYRVVPRITTKLYQLDGKMTVYAQAQTRWDPLLLVPEYEDVWFDESGDMTTCAPNQDNCATTRRDFDMATGNIREITKPMQYTAGTTSTTRAYDTRKLFVATEINERGHQTDYAYEYGTGTKLLTSGPNVAACSLTSPSTCPPSTPAKEEHRIRVDGLGRMIDRFETFSDTGDSYQTFLVEKNQYVDSSAASITHESAIDHDTGTLAVRYSKEQTELDGHGRPVKTTSFVFGTAPDNAVTSYVYGNDGTLVEARVPDPTQNDARVVSYTYKFDSLGRPTSIRRPDSTSPGNGSGVDITYNGLTQTTTEVVTDPGAHAASKRTTNDAFGRLASVEELISLGTWATTTYSYDPADNVDHIIDPEGVSTQLFHDFDGRRTKIIRAAATWEYGYDKNGNLWWKKIPCAEDAATCGANYISYFDYDDLDRVRHRYYAPIDLSPDDQNLFGITEELTYDTGPNSIGRVTSWSSYAPLGTVSSGSFAYNAQGQRLNTEQATNAAGFGGLTRSFEQNYWISGAVAGTYYRDVVGSSNCQEGSYSLTSYDNRGSLANVMIDPCPGSTSPSYIRNTRNVAGLVTKRKSDSSVGPNVESLWTYDVLGRVTSQDVHKVSNLDPIVRQDLEYFGNDDPKSLTHYLGANGKTFEFTYDYRHQLKTVDVPADPSYFAAVYEYGAAGRFTEANEESTLPPGSDVKPRNVEYHYVGQDPEQVTSLTDTTGTVATYQYDPAGNRTLSCAGSLSGSVCFGNSLSFVYDGAGRLRRTTKFDAIPQEAGSEEYWYDEQGQRNLVVKRDENRLKTELLWFIGDTEAHYDPAGNVTRAFGHVTLGTPVARFERSSDTAATVEYQFHGLANHTIAAVDQATGIINASFRYAPFGEVIEATNGGGSTAGVAAHRRRVNDKYVDEISELSYYGARYYDKTSMTWTQSDPLYRFAPDAAWAMPRKGALYTANLNNPLRYLDPDGRETEAIRRTLEVAGAAAASGNPVGEMVAVGLVLSVATVVIVTNIDVITRPIPTPAELAEQLRPIRMAPPDSDDGDVKASDDADVSDGVPLPLPNDKDPERQVPTDRFKPVELVKVKVIQDSTLEKIGRAVGKVVDKVLGKIGGGGGSPKSGAASPDSSSTNQHKPADADGDGKVTDQEESDHMREIK